MEIVLLLILYQLKPSAACFSQGTSPRPYKVYTEEAVKNDLKLYKKPDYWTPSYSKNSQWEAWFANYKQKVADLEAKEQQAVDNNFKDWDHKYKPMTWMLLPPGRDYDFVKDNPPPWAVVPQNHGKPHFCFIPPVRGTCRGYYNRWGFNPLTGSCQRFVYSGCGGNENNFLRLQRCKEACLETPARGSNCESYRRMDGTILIGKPGCD